MRLYTDVHHVGIALILPFSSIMVKSPCSHVAVFAISAEGVALCPYGVFGPSLLLYSHRLLT